MKSRPTISILQRTITRRAAPREGDFCEVSYYVDKDEATGRFSLWRRRNPTLAPDPLAGGYKEEIARDILGVRFEYSDGLDWYDNWGEVKGKAKAENSQRDQSNLDGLPEAVRITLLLDSNPKSKTGPQTGERTVEPPMVFQTVARLMLADVPQAGTAGSSDNSTGDSGGQSSPNNQMEETINRAKPRFHSRRFALVLALLSLVVVGALHTARMDLLTGKNFGDKIQARYLALAGIEKAEALLYQNAQERSHGGKNHTGELYNDAGKFRDVEFGRGTYSVLRRARPDEGGGVIYGVSDEESRLNVKHRR